jgi:UbiD family decarboxylase
LKRIEGADWDLEIGCITDLNVKKRDCPALLFDNIKGYPSGYRVVTSSTSSPRVVSLVVNLPLAHSDADLLTAIREKFPEWQNNSDEFPPQWVENGPILRNIHSGADIDLLEFPVPKWHELDGGRYIGTGDAVITKDPDTGEINIGTYRIMVHDRETAGLLVVPGQHGRIHYEKYHLRGEPCPVAVSIGHHPLIYRVGSLELPAGLEYRFAGAIQEQPVKVIREEVTGLPVPADSEAVIAGWCPPARQREEGPFGEWTGYYGRKRQPAPIIEVERVYHQDDPILLGSPPGKAPCDSSYFGSVVRSVLLHNELIRSGIPDVKGVWISEVGGRLLIIVSIKQRYAGHAKQAGLIASQGRIGSIIGRYVIVVDEDIDPSNTNDVLWALCTRSDPEKDIDIIRRNRSNSLDPMIRQPTKALSNSRAIIDACKPFEWIEEFPQEIETGTELVSRVKTKLKNLF